MERLSPSPLELTLASWRRAPSVSLADDIDALNELALEAAPAVGIAHWRQVHQRGCPADRGALLASLPSTDDPRLLGCLDAVQAWPADPRVTTALHQLVLQRLPRATELGFWSRVLPLVARLGDVRAVDWLADVTAEVTGPARAVRRLVRRANEVITFLGRRPRDAAVEAPRARTASGALVLPSCALQRQVLADELLERGDARGELIALQALPAPRPTQRRRAASLVRDFGRAWLGPLSAALKPEGLRFEAGAVVAGRVSGYRALATTAGLPHWHTVRELDLRELATRRAPRGALARFLAQPELRSLTHLVGFPADRLGELDDVPRLRLRVLHINGFVPDWLREPLVYDRRFGQVCFGARAPIPR